MTYLLKKGELKSSSWLDRKRAKQPTREKAPWIKKKDRLLCSRREG
jgi:hypothetical protein